MIKRAAVQVCRLTWLSAPNSHVCKQIEKSNQLTSKPGVNSGVKHELGFS